jgi:subtilisin family serine protease
VETGSSAVTIAIIDTGTDLSHPDLAPKIWFKPGEILGNGLDDDANGYVDDWQGWDFVNDDNDPMDDHGHGTHVSGIAAAASNNGTGIAGVSWGAQIMPLKVLASSGQGTESDVAAAVVYAADNGARVINLSLGGSCPLPAIEAAINYAYSEGAVIVAAAGNTGAAGVLCPAAYAGAIAVAATDANNNRAGFSNYGSAVDMAAPGVGIYSTYWSSQAGSTYGFLSGTSMAAPHVAGVAALLASLPQFDTPDKIRLALESTVLDLGPVCRDIYYGEGLVQAFAALQFDPSTVPPARCFYQFLPILGRG